MTIIMNYSFITIAQLYHGIYHHMALLRRLNDLVLFFVCFVLFCSVCFFAQYTMYHHMAFLMRLSDLVFDLFFICHTP